MKGRSQQQRPPVIADPPEDWGDGPWTVDCICGVTFDDGEEMVNCDECGVWVHTRCSRYVKGEQSFACDKCKGKKGRGGGGGCDNSEETEVAQLLVELPTKTMRIDGRPSVMPVPFRRRLWTEIPMEERIHVHGIPGGDPALFQDLSAVFSPELWKCTGYVPKKFNFQYREFPCWDDDGVENNERDEATVATEEENESLVDRGADVLCSLSKEIVPYRGQAGAIGSLRGLSERGGSDRKSSPREMTRRDWGKGGLSGGRLHSHMRRERNQLRLGGFPLGKRRKDELGLSKELSAKKKSRIADKGSNDKKRVGFEHAIDACKLDLHKNGDFKVGTKVEFQEMRSEDGMGASLVEPSCEGSFKKPLSCDDIVEKQPVEAFPDRVFEHSMAPETHLEDVDGQPSVKAEVIPRVTADISTMETKGIASVPIKEEDVRTAVDGLNHLQDESHNMVDLNGDSSSVAVDKKTNLLDGDRRSTAQDRTYDLTLPDSNGTVSVSSAQINSSTKMEADDVHSAVDSELLCSVEDGKPGLEENSHQDLASSDKELSENHMHKKILDNVHAADHAIQGNVRLLGGVTDKKIAEVTAMLCEPHLRDRESESPKEIGFKSRHSGKHFEDSSKFGPTIPSPSAPSLRKLVVGIGKSSSSVVFPKASVMSSYKSSDTPASSLATIKPTHLGKQRVKVKSSTDWNRENSASDMPMKDENKQEGPATVKDLPKSPRNYGSKPSHVSRNSHSSSLRHASDAKEQGLSSYKSSNVQTASNSTGALEISSPSHAQIYSQNKSPTLNSHQKTEKISQTSSQLSSKVSNHSTSGHPPASVNACTTLSDEELALLLHQELNSSPRVPRVPRMRQTGSIHQLSSPAAGSMLAKRASSSGGRDHILVSRRKSKEEAPKDSSRSARDLADEKKANRLSSSLDHRRTDSAISNDNLNKRDLYNRSPEASGSSKKNIPLTSSNLSNSGPSSSMEANEQALSSIRSSSLDTSDDETGVTGSMRTLPELIGEILSKGKHMTFEDLCNAILPHWQNLRKQNGDMYANSSQSQAVLDCLRNRNEWAHLVDCGPKTNSSRKKRKLDTATSGSEDVKSAPSERIERKNVESHKEDFPKGKRKARKCRRLQLHGRVLGVKKRQKADAISDDDSGTYSSEGTESIFSEDENVGTRSGEAASSSDDSGLL